MSEFSKVVFAAAAKTAATAATAAKTAAKTAAEHDDSRCRICGGGAADACPGLKPGQHLPCGSRMLAAMQAASIPYGEPRARFIAAVKAAGKAAGRNGGRYQPFAAADYAAGAEAVMAAPAAAPVAPAQAPTAGAGLIEALRLLREAGYSAAEAAAAVGLGVAAPAPVAAAVQSKAMDRALARSTQEVDEAAASHPSASRLAALMGGFRIE